MFFRKKINNNKSIHTRFLVMFSDFVWGASQISLLATSTFSSPQEREEGSQFDLHPFV